MRIIYGASRWAGPEHRQAIAAALVEPLVCGQAQGQHELVEGEGRGGDLIARALVEGWGWKVDPHRADWDRLGKAAGPVRSKAMVDSGGDLVVAMPAMHDGVYGGTGKLIDYAIRAGLWVNVRPIHIEEARLL